jgi:hypothetical protein
VSFRALATLLLAPVAALAVGAAPASATPSASAGSDGAAFVARTNDARRAHGLRPYAVAADLTAVAYRHSAEMAAQQRLYHNPRLASQVSNWQAVGENVGMGGSVDSIQGAFLRSPEHRANILANDFTEVGIATVTDSRGAIWVTEVFRNPLRPAAPVRVSRSAARTPLRHAAVHRAPARRGTPARPGRAAARPRLVLPAAPPANAGALARAVAFCRVMRALAG